MERLTANHFTVSHFNTNKLIRYALAVALTMWTLLSHAMGEDDPLLTYLKMDQLEYRSGDESVQVIEMKAWAGYDQHKLWLTTEGHWQDNGNMDDAEDDVQFQLLMSRAIAPYWDLLAGVQYDVEADASFSPWWLTFGAYGLAPYFFEVDIQAKAAQQDRLAIDVSVEYELMLTQQWLMMWELSHESIWYTADKNIASESELGWRIGYEIRRELMPYIGINYSRHQNDPHKADEADTQLLIGMSFWF